MYPPKSSYILVVLCLLLPSVVALVYPRVVERIPKGVWGGPHINMDVGESSVTIEYDCAHGAIHRPFVVDGSGGFNLRGTFTAERGGPVRADETPRERPATYSGTIKENTMTLTLKVDGEDESETFTLEKGKPGELFKCK